MSSSHGFSNSEALYAELLSFAVAALASGSHSDHALLLLHERYRESKDGETARRKRLLRSLISTPAQTPLGVAVKLTVACRLDGHLEAAQEAADGPIGSHVIVSALIDSLAQAHVLSQLRPDLPPTGRKEPRH
ncbi:hypothetical protein SAMN02982917_0650 [Azospirillum oryzae]|uniref:Uncharacterized protein n=1 Tax=Azospirillum oryzae TaxID=286727 RepID=A0A1X7DKZ5_9PROT|nr:hypothetical protein [Azospirillum oryzae]SMF17299.1 hypothetical protein SAMN02982917_0650 [Azospirillum oryzae]